MQCQYRFVVESLYVIDVTVLRKPRQSWHDTFRDNILRNMLHFNWKQDFSRLFLLKVWRANGILPVMWCIVGKLIHLTNSVWFLNKKSSVIVKDLWELVTFSFASLLYNNIYNNHLHTWLERANRKYEIYRSSSDSLGPYHDHACTAASEFSFWDWSIYTSP